MAEKNQDIRRNFIVEESKFKKRGQIFGFILVLFVLLPILIYSIYSRQNFVSITIIIAFVSILSIFILGKKKK